MSKMDEMINGYCTHKGGYPAPTMAAINIINKPMIYRKIYIEALHYKGLTCTFRHVERKVMIRRIFSGTKLVHKTRFNPNIDYKDLTKQKAYSYLTNIYRIQKENFTPKIEITQLHSNFEHKLILSYMAKYEDLKDQYNKVQYSELLRAIIHSKIKKVLDQAHKKFGVEIL